VSECRRHALIEAPIERVWELVGNPARHPAWFPHVVEVRGDRFETGDVYVQVTRHSLSTKTTSLQIDELDELRSLKFHCRDTGMYSNWLLTPAQDDTFVEAEFGMEPASLSYRVVDATFGRTYFRRWLEDSFEALSQAVREPHPERLQQQ
jgi:Polyketide cyclase / dehydrase and lipid transport